VTHNKGQNFASHNLITKYVLLKKQKTQREKLYNLHKTAFYICTFCFQNRQNYERSIFDAAKISLETFTSFSNIKSTQLK
jgi:hypothetical protein